MKKYLTSCTLIAALLLTPFMSACNGQADAQKAVAALAVVVNIAQAEETAVPTQDQAAYTNFVNLASSLETQLSTCVTNVSGVTGKSAKFLSCFNTFAQGLLSPTEQAQLRLLSPSTQKKVQLYLTAVVVALNIAIPAFGGSAVSTPVITSTTSTSAELQPILDRMHEAAGM